MGNCSPTAYGEESMLIRQSNFNKTCDDGSVINVIITETNKNVIDASQDENYDLNETGSCYLQSK